MYIDKFSQQVAPYVAPKESISVLDMFKIGVGPSSSHTLGPWVAAGRFSRAHLSGDIASLQVTLYGSLAKTGKGHGTDIAVMLGLRGEDPVSFELDDLDTAVTQIRQEKKIRLPAGQEVDFDPAQDIVFRYDECLPLHPNGLKFVTSLHDGQVIEEVWYSIGGGFVRREDEFSNPQAGFIELPCPVESAQDLADWCGQKGLPISGVVAANEASWRPDESTRQSLLAIWRVMQQCIYRGCRTEGELPGGLHVQRRAPGLARRLLPDSSQYDDHDRWLAAIQGSKPGFSSVLDWVSCFALAVNEENASFGRVVTAPTNGAAGVVPAVLQYLLLFGQHESEDDVVIRFLMTASEIGCLFKKGATISAAMGGCQAEIGVSSAMAAAGLTEIRGGSVAQCLMAAEIAMEHHLGLTCDPVGGLVQVPCVERNTMGAIKAITASQLALSGNPDKARVSLDAVIRTMWETARDMNNKYKETSDGGLAVTIPISLSEC